MVMVMGTVRGRGMVMGMVNLEIYNPNLQSGAAWRTPRYLNGHSKKDWVMAKRPR